MMENGTKLLCIADAIMFDPRWPHPKVGEIYTFSGISRRRNYICLAEFDGWSQKWGLAFHPLAFTVPTFGEEVCDNIEKSVVEEVVEN